MKVIIIGGNAAGMSVAAKIVRNTSKHTVVVYEKGEVVSFGSCGLPYYVGGYFSDHTRMFSRSPEAFIKAGIDLKLHHTIMEVIPASKEVIIQSPNGDILTDHYDVLVVASGSSAIVPPWKGTDLLGVFTLRDLTDGQRLKSTLSEVGKHAVVVGGGFIGLEIAEALRRQGKDVRIIELEDRLLKTAVGQEISDLILDELHAHDVSVALGERVMQLEGSDKHAVRSVKTDAGSYPADLVVLSLGIRPCTHFLDGTGIARLPNGAIIVDSTGRSSIDNVYAVGDCAAVPRMHAKTPVFAPLATTANKLGRIVGEQLSGGSRSYPGSLLSACVQVFDLEVARTGVTDEGDEKIASVVIRDKNQTNYYPGQEDILLKVHYNEETRRVLGAEVAGKNGAALRIDSLAMLIQLNGTVEDLALADFCYAPPFARTWDVMNVAGNVAL